MTDNEKLTAENEKLKKENSELREQLKHERENNSLLVKTISVYADIVLKDQEQLSRITKELFK